MKRLLGLCCLLLAAAFVIAGQTDLLNTGKEDSTPVTLKSAGPATVAPEMTGAAYEAMKERYYALIEKVNKDEATEAETTELREICFSWDLPLPEIMNAPEPEWSPSRDENPLDQGSTDTLSNCASATVIGALPYSDSGFFDGDNDCSVVAGSPYNEVFYTFTPSVTGFYQFRARSYTTGVAAIRVMSGGCCAGATSVAFSASSVATDCGEPSTVVTYARAILTAGTQYWIHVGTSSTTLSTAAYDFSMASPPCPPDESTADHSTCATAQAIALNDSLMGDSANGTTRFDWYQFSLAQNDSVQIYVGNRELGHCLSGSYPANSYLDARFTLYRGCGGVTDSINYDDDSGCSFDAKKNMCLAPGTYYVKVWNRNDSLYVFKLTDLGTCTPPVPPANDLCANAQVVGVPSSTPGYTSLGTIDTPPACTYTPTAAGVWYRLTGNNHLLRASLCTSSFDNRLNVYQGPDCSNLVCVGANDDDCVSPQANGASFIWCSDANQTYWLLVHGYSTNVGTFTLEIFDSTNCHVDCATYAPCGTPSEVEPNDLCDNSANFINLSCPDQGSNFYYGTICPQTDVDYYHVPAATLGQVFTVKLYDGDACSTFPAAGLRMKGATNADGTCGAATGTAATNYILGSNCAPYPGGYFAVVRNTGFENKYKIEFACSTAALPACPDIQLPKQFCAGPCVGPIVDVSSVQYSQNVALNETIDDVNVRINALHTYDGDVIFRLTSPASQTITLVNRRGGSGDNFQITVLDDEASTPIASGTAPFNGSFIPDTPLSTFDGGSTQGTWTLTVVDTAGGDVGYLNCWCLEFTSHSCVADQQIILAPDDPNFPAPQNVYACAHLVAGAVTQIVVPVHNPTNVPNLVVSSGCSVDGQCYDPTCVPLSAWILGDWTYLDNPPRYENTITASPDATGCCACLHLDYVLPVDLQGFTAVAGDRSVALHWSTGSERNTDHFELVRDGQTLTQIPATGSVNTGASYNWTERNLVNGTEYHYTLLAVDLDGQRVNLGTANATPLASLVVTEYALMQNYPNPFNPSTSITFDLVDGGTVSLKVFNLMGQAVATLVNGNLEAGRHTVSFDATGLPSGLYLYRLETAQFTAQHKMLLMK